MNTHATPVRSKHSAWRTLWGHPRPPTKPFEPSRQAKTAFGDGNMNRKQGWATLTHAEPFDLHVSSAHANRSCRSRCYSSLSALPNPSLGPEVSAAASQLWYQTQGAGGAEGRGAPSRSGVGSAPFPHSQVLVTSTHLIREKMGASVWGQGQGCAWSCTWSGRARRTG